MMRAALPLLLAFTSTATAAESPRAPRQPAGKWVLDYGETACTAALTYGSGEDALTLAFRPSPNGPVVRFALVRNGRAGEAHHFPVKVSLGAAPVKTTGLRFPTRDGKHNVVWINIDRGRLDSLAAAGQIAVDGAGDVKETLALPTIGKVLARMDECNADLRKYWNAGEFASALATPSHPTKDPQNWVSSSDYPEQAFREGASGKLRFVVLVDESGKVRDCLVEETSGIATLDAMACIAITRSGRFVPAVDAAGKPARSSWASTFVFRRGV